MSADVWWRLIRSWHAVVPSRSLEQKALCGRIPTGEVSFTLPSGRSCERCLYILAKRSGE